MVIRPLDDPTLCAQSVVADLAAISKWDFPTSGLGVRGTVGWSEIILAPH